MAATKEMEEKMTYSFKNIYGLKHHERWYDVKEYSNDSFSVWQCSLQLKNLQKTLTEQCLDVWSKTFITSKQKFDFFDTINNYSWSSYFVIDKENVLPSDQVQDEKIILIFINIIADIFIQNFYLDL